MGFCHISMSCGQKSSSKWSFLRNNILENPNQCFTQSEPFLIIKGMIGSTSISLTMNRFMIIQKFTSPIMKLLCSKCCILSISMFQCYLI